VGNPERGQCRPAGGAMIQSAPLCAKTPMAIGARLLRGLAIG